MVIGERPDEGADKHGVHREEKVGRYDHPATASKIRTRGRESTLVTREVLHTVNTWQRKRKSIHHGTRVGRDRKENRVSTRVELVTTMIMALDP